MLKKVYAAISTLAIMGLVFALVASPTWATHHTDSTVVKKTKKGKAPKLILAGGEIEGKVKKGSLDSYLEEHDLNEVEIYVEVIEKEIPCGDSVAYDLTFNFGPSGVYFDKPLELILKGKYVNPACMGSIIDEDGNTIEGTLNAEGTEMTFEISHFSTYNYESGDLKPYAASHYASKEIGSAGGNININSEASVKIKRNALNEYLNERGVDSVVITVELYYGWDGSLLFVFGPSGAHFHPELELTIEGGYVQDDMILVGENGESLEYSVKHKGQRLTFYIPHFSSYAYDDYDYY